MASEFWYPWYPTHYRRDAGHLDHVADSCYRRLLDWYMETGEPIKKDVAKLMHIMGVSAPQFQAVWPQLEPFFTLSTRGYLHHKRCDIELDRQDAMTRQKSIAGQRSAEKRKLNSSQYQLLTNDRQTDVQRSYERPSTTVPPTNKTGQIKELRKDADASPKQRLFNGALDWLKDRTGKSDDQCRAIIGRWLKATGDNAGEVLNAMLAAQRAANGSEAFEPVSYITATLKPKPKRKTEQMPL